MSRPATNPFPFRTPLSSSSSAPLRYATPERNARTQRANRHSPQVTGQLCVAAPEFYADFTPPIRGLYQASSATHGGSGVTGIPALQVVRRLRRDGY